jgi:ornithine cyclodeaminase/alanine dehydrogenase-like protein (mu-crystallin family)
MDGDEVRSALPMAAAIDALETAFAATDPSGGPPRTVIANPRGHLLMMPASTEEALGVKLVTVTPGNQALGLPFVGAVYVLFDGPTQQPRAFLDGAALTEVRTAAVSGLATRLLARPDARRLVILGAGVQGRSHVSAMRAVRSIEDVAVLSRTEASASSLVAFLRKRGVEARVGGPADLEVADLICTCTTSETPVVAGTALPAGVHVNAVGAYTPAMRELDTPAIARARVAVETREAALAEAGDLLIPIDEGAIGPAHILADLHELATGAKVRRDRDDVTVFKSVGLAFEDLVLAQMAAAR